MLGILAILLLELVALATAPTRDRPVVGGALVGGATVTFLVAAATLHRRRTAARDLQRRRAKAVAGDWFSTDALEGFPMETVRPRLLGPDAPSLNLLYTAWVLATHGHEAVWIERHLNLPADLAHLLADAAHSQGTR